MEKEKQLNIHGRMSKIKAELCLMEIKKTGENKYAGFKYHELSDFMPIINKLNSENGVNEFVEVDEVNGCCRLTIVNVDNSDDRYTIVTPFREAQMLAKGGAPSNVDTIQRMGSTITYNRRYLYMTAYNIQESDAVDTQPPIEKKEPVKQTVPAKAVTAKPQFTTVNFEKAYLANATMAQIKAKYDISKEVEDAYINYVIEKDKQNG